MTPRSRQFAGIALILVGILLFVLQWRGGASQAVVLAIIGGFLLLGYFARKQYGLLVPACILLGISLGTALEQTSSRYDNFSSLGLGIGFIAIYAIDRLFRGKTTWWPLVPGGILVVSGLAQAMDKAARVFTIGWPILIVGAGILVLLGIIGRGRDDEPEV